MPNGVSGGAGASEGGAGTLGRPLVDGETLKRTKTMLLGAILASSVLVACGDDDSAGTDDDYCARLEAYRSEADSLSSLGDVPDPATMEAAFTNMQSTIADLRVGPPSEIADEVTIMADAIDDVVRIFDQFEWDLQKLAGSPEGAQLQEALGGTDMQSARSRLVEYTETTCGLPSES